MHPEITPIVRGGIRTGGSLAAKGVDNIALIYDIRNSFRPTEKVPPYRSVLTAPRQSGARKKVAEDLASIRAPCATLLFVVESEQLPPL